MHQRGRKNPAQMEGRRRGSEYTCTKLGGLGWEERASRRKIKEGCINNLLSTSDRAGSTFFVCFLKAICFFFSRVIISCMASLCLYSYNSKVRKENYFHISNSLNASIFVAGSECIAFTHLNAYLEALSARASRLGALLSCIWVSGWGGAVSESSIILHQCHHHLRGPSQWSVSQPDSWPSVPGGGYALGSQGISYWLSYAKTSKF